VKLPSFRFGPDSGCTQPITCGSFGRENKGSDLDAKALEEQLAKLIPAQHREFAARHDKIHEAVDYDFVRSVIRQRIARGHNG
jgi:hypothetical protein